MKTKLLDYQTNALDILLYTKNTRLTAGETLDSISKWPYEKKLDHLDYMLKTISSSWEFANYIFEISGVSRAFTHQLVRTRTASYAQQAQRAVDVRHALCVIPDSCSAHPAEDMMDGSPSMKYMEACDHSLKMYTELIDSGVPIQDARGVLPTSVETSIVMGCNLRTLSHMAELRLCKRAQGEYQKVFASMRDNVLEVHPWAEPFIQVHCVKHGTCAFPNYTECPIQKHTMKLEDTQRATIYDAWKNVQHEANPVAVDGKAQ